MDSNTVDKVTSIIYYLYYHKRMFPHSIAGSHKVEDVFKNACELLLNMTPEQFETIAKEIDKETE